MAKRRAGPYKPYMGLRNPRYLRRYPLREVTGIRRFGRHAVKMALIRQPRPRRHARAPRGVRTRLDTLVLLEERAAKIKGSLQERIFYQALIDHRFIPDVDFSYQAAEYGGRAQLGGLVADFMFEIPKVIVQVQSEWHRMSLEIVRRDMDQSAMLQSLGYTVFEVWPNTIEDSAALDLWIERNIMHLWGTSATPLTGHNARDEAYYEGMGITMVDIARLEKRIALVEEALTGEVIVEDELGLALSTLDVPGQIRSALLDANLVSRLDRLESALFAGGTGPAVRISSGYIAQPLSSSNFQTGVKGWRISRDGTAEFQDLIARGTMQSDNFVSGSEGWRINELGDAEFHDVTVRGQIVAATFKHDAVSTIGGAMMIGPATNLAADITDVATALEVVDATFIDGDFLYIKIGGVYEVMEVTAGGGTTSLTVTRGIAGAAAAWKKGTAVVRKGDRIVLDTVAANTPYLDIIDHAGPLHDDEAVKVRLGNLAGISDPNMSPSGYGLYSDNAFLSGTAVFGQGNVILDSNGIKITGGTEDYQAIRWLEGGSEGDPICLITARRQTGINIVGMTIPDTGGSGTSFSISTVTSQLYLGDYLGNPLASLRAIKPVNVLTDIQLEADGAASFIDFRVNDNYMMRLTPAALLSRDSHFTDLGSATATDKWGNIYQAPAKDIFPNDDRRGLAARFINPNSLVNWISHFRTGDVAGAGELAGYAWQGAPFSGTPASLLYTSQSEYFRTRADGAGQKHFMSKAITNNAAAWQGKYLQARLLTGITTEIGIRFDAGDDNNWAELFITGVLADATYRLDFRYRDNGGGITTVSSGLIVPADRCVIVRLLCYYSAPNYSAYGYIEDEVGGTVNIAGFAHTLTGNWAAGPPAAGRAGIFTKNAGNWGSVDWFNNVFA